MSTPPLPLEGRRIVVTRAWEQAGPLAVRLEAMGARVVGLPTIIVAPPLDSGPLDEALHGVAEYDGFVFTSSNGVRGFFERGRVLGVRPRPSGGSWIGAVGPGTAAALDEEGWKATIVPAEHHAEGLLGALAALPLAGQKVLMPRAEAGRALIPEELTRRGAHVATVATHRTVAPERSRAEAAALFPAPGPGRRTGADAVVFTSSSTARNLATLLGEEYRARLEGMALAVIGPVTRRTIEELGLAVAIEAEQATVEGLAQAICDYYAGTS